MPIKNDEELHPVVKTIKVALHYEYYDAQGERVGTFWYSRADPELPLHLFYCGWAKAELCGLEILDPARAGYWRYEIEFPPNLIPQKSKRMSSKLAIFIWNYVISNFEAEKGKEIRIRDVKGIIT